MRARTEEVASDAAALVSQTPWVAFALVAATIFLARVSGRLAAAITPRAAPVRVGFGLPEVGVVVLLVLLWPIVLGLVAPIDREGIGLLYLSGLSLALPALVALGFAWQHGPQGLASIGIRAGQWFRAPAMGVALYLLFLPGIFALGSIWVWVLHHAGVEDVEQPIVKLLSDIPERDRLTALVLGAYVQPLLEEILFRGFLQAVLVQALRPLGGILLTSAVFAAIHGYEASVPIFGFSCLLGFVMWHTQRLHAAWTIHALHNGAQFLMLYAFPDSFRTH